MTETWGADTVLMPVPLPLAPAVADYIADLKAGRLPRGEHEADGAAVAVPDQGDWTEPMVRTLADQLSYPGVVALFNRCAGTAGEWVNKAAIEEAEGISPIQLRNELGALSKLTRRLFGQPIWPVQWKKAQGKYHYRMDSRMALWWSQARRTAR